MKFGRLRAVARKETLHVLRDPLSLAIAIALPLLLMILFGFALSFDVDRVPLVIWDQSQTQLSRDYVSLFTGSRYFDLVRYAWSYPEVEHAIDSGQALLALVVPREFAARVEATRAGAAQLIVDGSDSNTATIAVGYAETLTRQFTRQVALSQLQRLRGQALRPPLELRPRVWFNAEMESRHYIIPGLIAVIMMVIAALLTSLTVAREWERGTMEQLLSTPLTGPELIAGKLIPYFAIGLLDVTLVVLMAEFVFDVPLRGSVALLFVMAAVFLGGALGLGMLVSVATRNQLLANQLAMLLTFLPAYLLSGFMSPIENMPVALQWFTYVIPARYFVALLRSIYLKGVGLEILGVQAALLTLFGVLVVWLANVRFRKRLD